MERRVLGECFACINSHDFKAEDFLLELEGQFGVGGGVEWVLLEKALGFCCQMGGGVRGLQIGGNRR